MNSVPETFGLCSCSNTDTDLNGAIISKRGWARVGMSTLIPRANDEIVPSRAIVSLLRRMIV